MADDKDWSCDDWPDYCDDDGNPLDDWGDKDESDLEDDDADKDETVAYDTIADYIAGEWADYSAQTLDVVTSDGYVLSMYKIWHTTDLDSSLGPIMWMHGAGMNPTDWIQGFSDAPPMIQMASLGHPVYMLSQRGNSDSINHTSLNYLTNPEEYFDFSLDEFAIDVVAGGTTMFDDADAGKGWYFGYSQGTSQAMAAMALYQDDMADIYHRVVLLAPCFGT